MPVRKVCVLLAWHQTPHAVGQRWLSNSGGSGLTSGGFRRARITAPELDDSSSYEKGREREVGSPEGDIVQVKMEPGTT